MLKLFALHRTTRNTVPEFTPRERGEPCAVQLCGTRAGRCRSAATFVLFALPLADGCHRSLPMAERSQECGHLAKHCFYVTNSCTRSSQLRTT